MARQNGANDKQIQELLLQALEHEKGGVKVYETALECVINDDLREEWTKYLEETHRHVEILTETARELGLDPDTETPGRAITRGNGEALVKAMQKALATLKADAAQLVACDCVVLAETKDHANWHLLEQCSEKAPAPWRAALKAAVDEVEDQKDEHLYHSKGWARELWMESLGFRAALPPPEERKHVKTAIGAAKAEHARSKMR